MIKRFFIFLTVCFLLMPSPVAHAAIIRGGINTDECELVDRYFLVNADDGYVVLRNAPDREPKPEPGKIIRRIKNNTAIHIMFTYNYKGEFWGFATQDTNFGSSWIYAWVPMNQLLPMHDSVSFFKEHEDEFYSYTGNYYELKTAEKVILWPWPGSGKDRVTVRAAEAKEIENINIFHVYKDKDGREWGLIDRNIKDGYNSDVWVCVSDPGNDTIPRFNAPSLRRREPVVYVAPDFPHILMPGVIISGDSTFIDEITEKNKDLMVVFYGSLQFRELKYFRSLPEGKKPHGCPSWVYYRRRNDKRPVKSDEIQDLWQWLYYELRDAADPERFKIPYAFAFDLTPEKHVLCESKPDEIFDIIQGKNAILTWITPEIQWGDKLRIRYLRDYIKILKENGHVDWAQTIENFEGVNYLYDDLIDPEIQWGDELRIKYLRDYMKILKENGRNSGRRKSSL